MIFYAELNAEINLTDLDNFLKNFAVFKLEKKVEKLQADLESLQYKHNRLVVNLSDFIKYTVRLSEPDVQKVPLTIRESYLNRGDLLFDFKEYWHAILEYKKAQEKDPSMSLDYSLLRIIEALTQEIELNPNDANLYDTRGFAYASLKKYDEAIADYTQAIKLDPKSGSLYARRASAYEKIGENEKSEKDRAKVEELRG